MAAVEAFESEDFDVAALSRSLAVAAKAASASAAERSTAAI